MRNRSLLYMFAALLLPICGCRQDTVAVMSCSIRMGVANAGENSWRPLISDYYPVKSVLVF